MGANLGIPLFQYISALCDVGSRHQCYGLHMEQMSKEIDFKNRDRFIQLGITISVLRKMRGMSQEQLAAEAMMSRSHLSAIEAPNIVRPFSVEVLFNIADALKVEPGDLLNTSIIPDQILNKKEK